MDWLLATLGTSEDAPSGRYLARPSAEDPQLLIPLDSPQVSRRALVRHHDDRSRRDRVVSGIAQSVALAGQLHRAPGEVVELPGTEVVSRAQSLLGIGELWPAITMGPRRRNRKPVLQLITPDGHLAGFAKVGWSELTRELVENEAIWLTRIQGTIPLSLEAPIPLGLDDLAATETAEKRVMALATGLALPFHLRPNRPLRRAPIIALARSGGSAHVKAGRLDHVSEQLRLLPQELAQRFLELHGDATVEVGLWHGDLTPWNMASGGGITRVWDWEFADENRPVGFDLLHRTFERTRRQGAGRTDAALREVVATAPNELVPLGQPSDTVVDLYLIELLHREHRLQNQDWESPLGELTPHVIRQLTDRLGK